MSAKTKLFVVKDKGSPFLKRLLELLLKKEFLDVRCIGKKEISKNLKDEWCELILFEDSEWDIKTIKDVLAQSLDVFLLFVVEKEQTLQTRIREIVKDLSGLPFDLIFSHEPEDIILNKIKVASKFIKNLKSLKKHKLFKQIVFVSLSSIRSWDLNSFYRVFLSQLENCFYRCVGIILEFDSSKDSFKVKCIGFKSEEELKSSHISEEEIASLHKILFDPEKSSSICLTGQNLPEESFKFKQAGFNSLAIMPLRVKNELYGSFMFLSSEHISEEDLSFLEHLSRVISFMISYINLIVRFKKLSKEFGIIQQTTSHQERLRSLGQMASGIAHDLNNVVTPLIGFSQLLLEKEPHLSNKGRQYLQHVIKAGEDIKNIISRLRQFYRKKDELEERFTLVDINKLILEAIDLTKPKWKDIPQEKGITVELDVQLCSNMTKAIKGIPSEIREALINLIINSVDALPEGGKITIRSKISDDFVVVEVEDRGIGMDKYTLEHCVEPFFTTKGKEGSGLGLSIVYGIMERHSGKMEIKSKKGKGTVIYLYFPIARKEEKTKEDGIIQKEVEIPKLRILHIDDDRAVLRVVKDMLEGDGHRVKTCLNPEKGIEIFKKALEMEPFDLVITDLGMPNMEGKKLASIIKEMSPKTPVILLTGWDIEEENLEAIGIDYVLKKPISFYDLRKAILDLCLKGILRGNYGENSFSLEPKGG